MGEETTTAVSFHALTEADIPAIEAIEATAFYDAWNENMLRNELDNALTTYVVMESEGKIIGYAGFWLVAGEAQVTRVAVLEELRGQGLGTRLTASMVNKAWELGADAITLEVRESNLAAQKAYLTCGFASEGVRPNYYEDNHENAIIMWLYKQGAIDG